MHVWAGVVEVVKEDRGDPENLPLLYASGDVGERAFELRNMKCGSVSLYGADVRAVIETEVSMYRPRLWAGPLREKVGASKLNPDKSPSEREIGVVVGFKHEDYDVQLRRKGDQIMLFVSFGWSLDEIELPAYWHDSELLWRWSPYPGRRMGNPSNEEEES